MSVTAEDVRKVVSNNGPVEVVLGALRVFQGDSHDVLYVEVIGNDIRKLNRLIRESVPHVETHPEYIPHICLAYLKPGVGKKYEGDDSLVGTKLTFHNLTYSDRFGTKHEIGLGDDARAAVLSNGSAHVLKGQWITIGSKEDSETGKKHGGTHVYIENGGKISRGPDHLEGKKVSDIGKEDKPEKKKESKEEPKKEGKKEDVVSDEREQKIRDEHKLTVENFGGRSFDKAMSDYIAAGGTKEDFLDFSEKLLFPKGVGVFGKKLDEQSATETPKEEPKKEIPDDKLSGGLADTTPKEEFPAEKVAEGAKVEREHTDDPKVAEEIARDHLKEDPDYYEKLKEVEKPNEPQKEEAKQETKPEETKEPEKEEEKKPEPRSRREIEDRVGRLYSKQGKKLRDRLRKLAEKKVSGIQSRYDAEDAIQETMSEYAKLMEKGFWPNDDAHEEKYLINVMKNVIGGQIEHETAQKRDVGKTKQSSDEEKVNPVENVEARPEENADSDLQEMGDQLMSKLPDRQSEILRLYLDGKSTEDIAQDEEFAKQFGRLNERTIRREMVEIREVAKRMQEG